MKNAISKSHNFFALTYQLIIIITFLISPATSEEWYTIDANIISDVQFDEKILLDHSTFKIVKYFTPYCVYCRYLKKTMDDLKHARNWSFIVYDFNCQAYPQFCLVRAKATSFPYVGVYDTEGNLVDQIHGYYPTNIIEGFLERTEEKCPKKPIPLPTVTQTQIDQASAAKITENSLRTQIPKQNVQHDQIITPTNVEPQVQKKQAIKASQPVEEVTPKQTEKPPPKLPQKQSSKPILVQVQKQKAVPQTEKLNIPDQIKQEKQATIDVDNDSEATIQQKIATSTISQHQTSKQQAGSEETITSKSSSTSSSISSYIFYFLCCCIGGYYFYQMTRPKKNEEHEQDKQEKVKLLTTTSINHKNTLQNKEDRTSTRERSAEVSHNSVGRNLENEDLVSKLRDDEL